jgi:hypothetical protein
VPPEHRRPPHLATSRESLRRVPNRLGSAPADAGPSFAMQEVP